MKFITNSDHRIYMQADSKKVYGFIKIGTKNLFHRDYSGNVKEISPLCVLDFYVHESVQRHGIGKAIFEKMLETERVDPRKLA
jgi:alpha-tubulin N-acetyltransferase 1